MSRDLPEIPSPSHKQTMEKFVNCLQLEQVDENMYRGFSPDFGWRRIFGGQFIAQALRAAQATVRKDRYIHSLHCYFARAGDPDAEIIFKVDPIRDGASFSLRSITAYQQTRVAFTMQASFHKFEKGLEHQITMPRVADPETIDFENAMASNEDRLIVPLKEYFDRERPFELRPLSLDRYFEQGPLEPDHTVWLKLLQTIPQAKDPHMCAAMLAYISDALLIDTALFPHATNIFDGQIQGASLDHAMWFHMPFHMEDWILYDMESPVAAGARGKAHGNLFSKDGQLIATVAQEGLIRKRANA